MADYCQPTDFSMNTLRRFIIYHFTKNLSWALPQDSSPCSVPGLFFILYLLQKFIIVMIVTQNGRKKNYENVQNIISSYTRVVLNQGTKRTEMLTSLKSEPRSNNNNSNGNNNNNNDIHSKKYMIRHRWVNVLKCIYAFLLKPGNKVCFNIFR